MGVFVILRTSFQPFCTCKVSKASINKMKNLLQERGMRKSEVVGEFNCMVIL